ncbi:MAG: uroporphyrinogen-III synthase, partial [Lachnospiraceae bacterium]|nr:uroporphyrinogen-III synthase [Lachnospiraceae bacterium]
RTRGTLVFLMGVSALGEICRGLLNAGMDPETPAALLMRGTTAGQQRIVATVKTLEEEVKRQGACTPAIIVVGAVCSVAEPFSWYEKQPLGGVKVLLTRPKERIGETAAKLRALGAEVLELPAIRTERIPNNERLSKALAQLSSYQWIVFTSPTGVRVFFEEMAERGIDCRALGTVRFAVIGNGTKKALAKRGFYADLVPDVFDAAHLGRTLRETIELELEDNGSVANGFDGLMQVADDQDATGRVPDVQNASGKVPDDKKVPRILVPRAAIGSPELLRELVDAYFVEDIPTYETRYESSRFVDLQQEFAEKKIDYVVFTSASTIRGFTAAVPGIDYTQVQAVCIGKQTAAEADQMGMKTYTAEQASIDSLIQCLIETVKYPL